MNVTNKILVEGVKFWLSSVQLDDTGNIIGFTFQDGAAAVSGEDIANFINNYQLQRRHLHELHSDVRQSR